MANLYTTASAIPGIIADPQHARPALCAVPVDAPCPE
jgi:hypothetical protein